MQDRDDENSPWNVELEQSTARGEGRALADLDRPYSVVVVGDGYVQTHALPLRGDVVIGRGEGADIVIAEAGVSRRHACLRIAPNAIQLEDLGSRNGTTVERVRLAPGTSASIRVGDVVEVGATLLILQDRFTTARPRRIW